MQEQRTEAEQQVASALLAYLNRLEGLPCEVVLEKAAQAPALLLELLEGPVYKDLDLAGGYTAEFPFAISYRYTPATQAQRLEAAELLCAMAEQLETAAPGQTLDLGPGRSALNFAWTSFPAQAGEQTENMEQYRTKFILNYLQEEQ